jgi:transcription elongation factor GreA-like protein
MSNFLELSIVNLSQLAEEENFLLQTSKKSEKLGDFIKNSIPKSDKCWLTDLKPGSFQIDGLKI